MTNDRKTAIRYLREKAAENRRPRLSLVHPPTAAPLPRRGAAHERRLAQPQAAAGASRPAARSEPPP